MNDLQLKTLIEKFKKLDRNKKIFIISTFFILIISLIIVLFFTNFKQYKTLYKNLSEEDMAKIIKILEEDKVSYKIKNDEILIPENLISKQRVKIAGAGIVLGGGIGMELFDKFNFGMSEDERKINLQRALQTEFERTINKIPGIVKNRVHLFIPEKKIFEEERQNAKASVYLEIKPGYKLSKETILGIQNLIANGVENLLPNNVVIISTDGKVISDMINDDELYTYKKLTLTKNIEDYIKNKIQIFLDGIVGFNNSTVSVTVDLEMNKTEIAREIYQPTTNKAVVKSENVISETSGDSNNNQITLSNIQSTNQGVILRQNKNVNYELDKEIQRIMIYPGQIKNISIAVVLNAKYDEKYLNDLKQSIAIAVGLNSKRGDVIDIKAMEFKNNFNLELKKFEENKKFEFYYNLAKDFLPLTFMMILAIFISFYTMKQISGFKIFKERAKNNGDNNKEIHLSEEDILKIAKENPEEVSKVIKSWIT